MRIKKSNYSVLKIITSARAIRRLKVQPDPVALLVDDGRVVEAKGQEVLSATHNPANLFRKQPHTIQSEADRERKRNRHKVLSFAHAQSSSLMSNNLPRLIWRCCQSREMPTNKPSIKLWRRIEPSIYGDINQLDVKWKHDRTNGRELCRVIAFPTIAVDGTIKPLRSIKKHNCLSVPSTWFH